ncbi:hydantoinase/oxoprolinase family protein [Brevibacillus centrosporus]|uniref:hydantoinase/oxoprolinase family protein n=1 Tax=Brevibacillus centrosporus TaxID=54910 RepID=UPI000F0A09D9|nr:hydantoinase/oxoprolinase family protein [Brevibacillus centrosporus]MEC2131397.1 hydantoinase/oxoprolinase family protein [Brevibacillus centrosporus]RNB72578.1 hydantoinase/oxoprolinase family protein [Brevibacillus centrosporus]GED31610.1 5-oxoprolinase [Brevibacillus centrosporus]
MRVATDIGGTFTDLVYVDEHGDIGVAKSPTTPPNFEQGVMDVIEVSGIEKEAIHTFIHGSTVIINALTERKGIKTGLITTKGFRDVLEIARGNRPDLFNVRYHKPEPFVPRYLRLEVEERLNYQGEIIRPLDREQVKSIVSYFQQEEVKAVAIAYLHAYVNPVHEQLTVALIKELWPEVHVTASHEVTKEWREYERTNTTVLNSYVKPTAASYINKLQGKLKENGVDSYNYIMQSNGGTTTFAQAKETPINMVESGPVAGVYGAAVLGELIGETNLIAFDIGGTTAKCSLIDKGGVKVSTDYYIERSERSAGYPIKVPVVDIVEIGNGGGSIAWIDDAGSLKVGPESAGALPGPVAYGLGGTKPTTTDANLVAGRLAARNFGYNVDLEKVKQAIHETVASHFDMSVEEAALGMIRIADSNMLNALKLVSVRKGYDPRDFTLVAFGGGGPMHAPILAKELGVKKVVVPTASSVFSAWGMLMTDLRRDYIQTYIKRLGQLDITEINQAWAALEQEAWQQYEADGLNREAVIYTRFADMRYVGQEHTVKVQVPNGEWQAETFAEIVERFHQLHEKTYTFRLEQTETEIVSLHVTAFGKVQKPTLKKLEKTDILVSEAIIESRPVYFEGKGWVTTDVYDRHKLSPGASFEGPAIVEERSSSTVMHPGQSLTVDEYGNLIILTGVN